MSRNALQKKKHSKSSSMHTPTPVDRAPQSAEIPAVATQEPKEGHKPNVAATERVVSSLIGASLLAYGVTNLFRMSGQGSSLASVFFLARGLTGYCPIYQALHIDSTPSGHSKNMGIRDPRSIKLRHTMSLDASPQEVMEFCRDNNQLARCFSQVKHVHQIDSFHSNWIVSDQFGVVRFPVAVEMTQSLDPLSLSWVALPVSQCPIHGQISCKPEPHGHGTELTVSVEVMTPAGLLGKTLIEWLSPIKDETLSTILHKMKQLMETGEVSKSHDFELGPSTESDLVWSRLVKNYLQVKTIKTMAQGSRL